MDVELFHLRIIIRALYQDDVQTVLNFNTYLDIDKLFALLQTGHSICITMSSLSLAGIPSGSEM